MDNWREKIMFERMAVSNLKDIQVLLAQLIDYLDEDLANAAHVAVGKVVDVLEDKMEAAASEEDSE